ncbi:hypothetical protein [Phenylobacterium sp.]|uniref:hypothetical protein n=1 Tax=Phenylobacterium sp. TaxID=1871053 RepID=UPI00391DF367
MSDQERQRRNEWSKTTAEGALSGATELVEGAVKRIPRDAAKATRIVAKTAAAGPEKIYEIIDFMEAPDKKRALAKAGGAWAGSKAGGALGARIGAGVGGLVGAVGGPLAEVTMPAGVVLGGIAGGVASERLYDNRERIAEAIRRGAGTAKQWMAMRGAQMMAPYWPVDDYYRARGR